MKQGIALFTAIMIGGLMTANAVNHKFSGDGKSSDGFFLWNDANNFVPAAVPGISDAATFSGKKEIKTRLTENLIMLSLTVQETPAVIQGAENVALTLSNYVFMKSNGALTLDSARVTVGGSIRFSGAAPTVALKGNSRLRAALRFDEADAVFSLTLNNYSVYEGLAAPIFAPGAGVSGGSITLNDSSVLHTSISVAQLDNQYLSKGVVLSLNGSSSVKFTPAPDNAERIAACIAAGKILINGEISSDYYFDSQTGIFRTTMDLPPAGLTVSILSKEVEGLRLPAVFSDHMVLQHSVPVPVWGKACAGKTVEVNFAGQTKSAIANDSGDWMVMLDPLTVSVESRNMIITSSDENQQIIIHDVLVGEVWLASGQSNMGFSLKGASGGAQVISEADFPLLRIVKVLETAAAAPAADAIYSIPWSVSSPQSVPGFSAVAYFFGRRLYQELNIPVGLIQASWGGTKIEPWTSPDGFAAVPSLREIYEKVVRDTDPDAIGTREAPASLYYGMIHPLVPYAVRGVIWYQGESNRRQGMEYYDRFDALLSGWRGAFNNPALPFYYVQIAPHSYGDEAPEIVPEFWEVQTRCLDFPNTGMAVINDAGDPNDVHPVNKQPVGERLAGLALKNTYGRDLVATGPVFRNMKIENAGIRIEFDSAGGGLASRDGKTLSWFEIKEKNGDYVPAAAVIDGETVFVSSPAVRNPVAVRFAWNKIAEPNLINREGLPAGAFRCGEF